MKVLFPAVVAGIKTRKDRTLRVELDTPELGPDDSAKLFSLAHDQGWTVISSNDDITDADIPEVKAEVEDSKTPSQRLRAVLHVYWRQKGSKLPWERFYTDQMERLIQTVKDKLEPEEG